MTAAAKPVPDIAHVIVKASQLSALDQALGGIFTLSPPPTIKGRYALAKAAKAIGPAHQTYQEQKLALLQDHAVKKDGKPVFEQRENTLLFDFGHGIGVTTPEVNAALKELNDEDISLPGVRMITHAELGDCPITVQQEAALLGVLLTDEAPE